MTKQSELSVPLVKIERIGGLGDIMMSGGNIRPRMYATNSLNKDDDTDARYVGDYGNRPMLNSKDFLAPMYDSLRRRWSWDGDITTLKRLVKKLNLKYPKGHHMAGQMIKVESLESHVTDENDPIFRNPVFYPGYMLKGGRGNLLVASPKEEFLYYCFKGRRDFVDETGESTDDRKTFSKAGAKYKMTAPKRKNLQERSKVDVRIKAATLLGQISTNEERLRAICTLANIPGFSKNANIDGMVVLLENHITHHGDERNPSHNNAKNVDVFISYAEMPNDRLKFEYDVKMGQKKAIIRSFKGGFNFQGEMINGPENFHEIVTWFSQSENIEKYIELTTALAKAL